MQPDSPPPQPAIPVILDYGRADLLQEQPILSVAERVIHFLTVIVLPIACFAISFEHYMPGPEWQRGKWADYLGIIPTKAGWPFYPLLMFSMFAGGWCIFRPRSAVQSLFVRVGLISGIALAWQYAFIQIVSLRTSSMATDIPLGLFIPAAAVTVLVILHRLLNLLIWHRQWYHGRVRRFYWIGLVVLLAGAMLFRESRQGVLGVAIFGPLFLAPGLTMTSLVLMLIACLTHGTVTPRDPLVILAWIIGWLAAFASAWIKSYQFAVEAYTKLPTSDPSCYIATAAAQGHGAIVGSWSTGDGHRINRQLALFKAGEKAIARRSPETHRWLRSIYDTIGPVIARQMSRRWLADLAYLTLKPLEWLTAAVLALGATRKLRPASHGSLARAESPGF